MGESCCQGGSHKEGSRPTDPTTVATGHLWTCPMHPEVVRSSHGACPDCGMALEPMEIGGDVGPNIELIDFTRRFWLGLIFTLPLFFLEMGVHLGIRIDHFFGITIFRFIEGFLATPVVLWCGAPFFVRGFSSLRGGVLNMFTLISMGVGVAYIYSVFALFFGDFFPLAFRLGGDLPPLYFESAAVIVVLVLLGQCLELRARDKVSHALRSLLDLTPETAWRRDNDGSVHSVSVADISVGDFLVVKPGERIAVDGIVREGHSSVDTSLMTGESFPVPVSVGDRVIGGSVNGNSMFVFEADVIASDRFLSRMISLVNKAQRSRMPIQSLVDKISSFFVPGVIFIGVLAFFLWSFFGPPPSVSFGIMALVSTLIIACPCALGLATPMSVMVALGRGAGIGVFFRDAASLERFSRADTIIFDKTGTLTEGRPRLVDSVSLGCESVDHLLYFAVGVEQYSAHPISTCLLSAFAEFEKTIPSGEDIHEFPGKGITGVVEGRVIILGNRFFLESRGISFAKDFSLPASFSNSTVIYISLDGILSGYFVLQDPLRSNVAETISGLRDLGFRLLLASGDRASVVSDIGDRLGLDEVHGALLPEDKMSLVSDLQSRGHIVVMVGDGVNDSPALALSDIGISMGEGSDAAIESSSVTLMDNDLHSLIRARRLSCAGSLNIRQNLFFAFIYNALSVPVAAGLLYPFTGFFFPPALAAFAMSLSSVSVILNALRLRYIRF